MRREGGRGEKKSKPKSVLMHLSIDFCVRVLEFHNLEFLLLEASVSTVLTGGSLEYILLLQRWYIGQEFKPVFWIKH